MIHIDQIKKLANGQWDRIVRHVIPSKYLSGNQTACPLCGAGKDRFVYDNRKGMGDFYCRQCGGGIAPHLISRYYKIDMNSAWLKIWCILGEIGVAPSIIQEVKNNDLKSKADRIRDILKRCTPGLTHPSVIEYIKSRAIPVEMFRNMSYVYTGELEYWYKEENRSEIVPAMVCVTVNPSGKKTGLHVTYIKDGKKLDRRMYGTHESSMRDSVIRLMPPVDGGILLAEGIETAISASILLGVPCWPCMDAGKLERFMPPPGITKIIIAGDCDKSYTGQRAAFTLANRIYQKIQVRVVIPKVMGTDWNDVLKEKKL